MGRIEVITRTERRRKYSDAKQDAILREADAHGVTVREVAKPRHEIAESLIYGWRSARRQAEKITSELLAFISYGTVTDHDLVTVQPTAPPSRPASTVAPRAMAEELTRPHPGTRPGGIDIDLPSGVRLSVDSYVNEKALARVLRTLQDIMISLAPGTKVYLASRLVSMRLGFDGLAALVRPLFSVEPYCGHVFLFRSKSGTYLQALHWDGSGICLCAKRLERHRFVWPPLVEGGVVLTSAQFALLVEAMDWRRTIALEAPHIPVQM